MITLLHVTAGYHYVDEEGQVVGIEDVFTKPAAAKAYRQAIGAPWGSLEALVR